MTVNRVAPGANDAAAAAADVEALADAACVALVAYRAAREEAQQAEERARVLREDAVLELHDAGWSVRRVAAELELSSARIGQLVLSARARRAAEWGEVGTLPAGMVAADRLESFHAARHAQELREENYTSGGATERAAFYGALDAPIVDEAEAPLTWKAFLQDAAGQEVG